MIKPCQCLSVDSKVFYPVSTYVTFPCAHSVNADVYIVMCFWILPRYMFMCALSMGSGGRQIESTDYAESALCFPKASSADSRTPFLSYLCILGNRRYVAVPGRPWSPTVSHPSHYSITRGAFSAAFPAV